MHIHKEKFYRFSRDIVGRDVVDAGGVASGKVRDAVAMPCNGGLPVVTGLVVEKKFIPWEKVASIGRSIKLNAGWFSIGPHPIPGDALFLRHILDEQLLDHDNRAIGRVDDLCLKHDAASHRMHVTHIFSGPLLRIGLGMGHRKIPWVCVERIARTKPTAIVLRLDRTRHASHSTTDKIVVKAR